jgi:secondary thiamine-phosphate synthase enzyme
MTMPLQQVLGELTVATRGQGLYPCTDQVAAWLASQVIGLGLLTLFLRHTSASLLIQENADPDVVRDLADFFRRLVPEEPRLYRHRAEGPDDMPAHIRTALTAVQLAIPVTGGRLALGQWQGIYLFEHRARGHQRRIALHLLGE